MADGPNLQGPRRQNSPEPYADLVARLVKLRQDVNDLTGSILRSAGIRVSPEGMTIESALDVLGSLDVSGTMAVGGTMNVTGDAVFSGDLAVPNGSITNAALENPVAFDSGKAISAGNSMNLTVAEQTFCSLSFVVPVGYTRALVQGQGSIGVVNPMTVISSVAGRVYIDHPNADPAFGARRWQSSNPGTDAAVSPVHAGDFTVAGGDTITVRLTVQGGTSTSWGATPGGATLSATVLLGR